MSDTAPSSYDLRSLFKAVGRVGGRSGESAAVERSDAEESVHILDSSPLEITCEPAVVAGFVDGIQSHMHITHRSGRPVLLYYVGAGALGMGATPLELVEKLRLQCSDEDRPWVDGLNSHIPVEILPGSTPPDMEVAAIRAVSVARDEAERDVVNALLSRTDDTIVVDGSLLARPRSANLVGVVKTTRSRYLGDESVLWNLHRGWRSPRFTIGEGLRQRYSCYVQLVDKRDGPWNLGLIRLESFDADVLEPMAARCLREVQTARSGDARWDRHLGSVRAVEEFLRARRPAAFSLL